MSIDTRVGWGFSESSNSSPETSSQSRSQTSPFGVQQAQLSPLDNPRFTGSRSPFEGQQVRLSSLEDPLFSRQDINFRDSDNMSANEGEINQGPGAIPRLVDIGVGGSQERESGASQSSGRQASVASSRGAPTVTSLHDLQFQPYAHHEQGNPTSTSETAAKNKYKQLFKDTPTPIEDLRGVEVLLPKSARGEKGSTEYRKNMSLATYSLEHEFGVAMCHVDTRSDVEDGDQTSHQYIQERYMDNLAKLDNVIKRGHQYDMMDVMMVPTKVIDPQASKPCDMFGFEQVNLFESWNKLSWETVCTWQWAINTSGHDEEKISSNWFKEFLENSCTTTLRGQLDAFYSKLALHFKGAATYAYLLCQAGILPLLSRSSSSFVPQRGCAESRARMLPRTRGRCWRLSAA